MAKTRLQEKYLSEVAKAMHDKFQYKNVMEIPKIEKVVINMGVGEAADNSRISVVFIKLHHPFLVRQLQLPVERELQICI